MCIAQDLVPTQSGVGGGAWTSIQYFKSLSEHQDHAEKLLNMPLLTPSQAFTW